jgi:hypothetical protein
MDCDHPAGSTSIATLVGAALRFPEQAHAICCNQFCGETQGCRLNAAQPKFRGGLRIACATLIRCTATVFLTVRTGMGAWERHREVVVPAWVEDVRAPSFGLTAPALI